MSNKRYVLGIDTSNYTTSVAVTDADGAICADCRRLLAVKKGERGLRQSEALFQHIGNLPELIGEAFQGTEREIRAVAVSTRPRPIAGSYMPVFKAGASVARSIAATLRVPVYEFSHQEGHIESVKTSSGFQADGGFLAYHLSGGTCELLDVHEQGCGFRIETIGGSLDLSYGQILDRIGVALGMAFPAGAALDALAASTDAPSGTRLKPIAHKGTYVNLSGIETQCQRALMPGNDNAALIKELFERIAVSLEMTVLAAGAQTGYREILFVGGVSGSTYIKNKLQESLRKKGMQPVFTDARLAQDNAVGIAFLGGKAYEADQGFSA